MKIALVTACPSGIATTIIAAGLLEKAAVELQWQANIECQTAFNSTKTLTQQQIDDAEVIIIAAGIAVDDTRFVGKKFIKLISPLVLKIPKHG